MTRSRLLMRAAVVLTAALVAPLAACTSHPVDPERAGTVVVAVDSPFTSLNAGLPEGRTAGSTLVRGLVQDELVGLDGAGTVVTDPRFGTVAKVSDSPLTVRYTIAPGARWSDGVARPSWRGTVASTCPGHAGRTRGSHDRRRRCRRPVV